ncbi:MAG: Mut7-C RNAse domain-containing protein [bacterium]|nr:Mut7-C RNAse domain-containing protein [bacterium]
MKFVADNMLGRLAKWLRILGYDTVYVRTDDDEELIDIAETEDRILLTRDTRLAKSWVVPTVLIKSEEISSQLKQVIKRYNLDLEENLLSRCPICNIEVSPIDKERIFNYIPKLVYETYNEFWTCKNCGRYYWEGTHWKNIKQKVKEIRMELSDEDSRIKNRKR